MSTDIAITRARLESAVAMDAPARPDHLTVQSLAALYLAHATKRFNGRHGKKEHANIRQALKPLLMLYGELEPDAIRPLHVRAARQMWIEQRIARTTIQARMQRLRKCWKWAVSVELLTKPLPEIEAVRFGVTRDTEPVKPVPMELFEATLPALSPMVRTMLRLMLLTGMRPGEVADLTVDAIDTTVQPWCYRPKLHKTRHLFKDRTIFIGPRAQMLIQPSLSRASAAARQMKRFADALCDSAKNAESAISVARATNLFLTWRGNPWTSAALNTAVWKACEKLGLPHWSPGRLRHSAATMLRQQYGLDTAQAVLGHARIETTQQYSLKQMHLAAEAMLAVG